MRRSNRQSRCSYLTLNMAYAAGGSQVPFTSINLEFGVPEFFEDEPPYGPRGERAGVYGDFADEARLLTRAFTEVLLGGRRRWKTPPLPEHHLLNKGGRPSAGSSMRNSAWSMNSPPSTGQPIFINMLADYRGDMANYMGYRTSPRWITGPDWDRDCRGQVTLHM